MSEQIYELLKQDILTGRLKSGEKIVNRELQEKYGVSSTPIRDAINRLYQDGLIENITRVGARVIQFNAAAAMEVFEVLSIICSSAVRFSAKSSPKQEVAAILRKAIDTQEMYLWEEKYFDYDYIFHKTFFDYSNNGRLKALYKQYSILYKLIASFYHEKIENRKETISQHEEIYSAYINGDIDRAAKTMEYHFIHAGDVLKGLAARQS